jgi:hypothetical protein
VGPHPASFSAPLSRIERVRDLYRRVRHLHAEADWRIRARVHAGGASGAVDAAAERQRRKLPRPSSRLMR